MKSLAKSQYMKQIKVAVLFRKMDGVFPEPFLPISCRGSSMEPELAKIGTS